MHDHRGKSSTGDKQTPAQSGTDDLLPYNTTVNKMGQTDMYWVATEGQKERDNGERCGWLNVRVNLETLLYSDDQGVTAGLRTNEIGVSR